MPGPVVAVHLAPQTPDVAGRDRARAPVEWRQSVVSRCLALLGSLNSLDED